MSHHLLLNNEKTVLYLVFLKAIDTPRVFLMYFCVVFFFLIDSMAKSNSLSTPILRLI